MTIVKIKKDTEGEPAKVLSLDAVEVNDNSLILVNENNISFKVHMLAISLYIFAQ